jgi:hypothetical protein
MILSQLHGRMTVNEKFEKMWKEVGMTYFNVLSQHFSGENEENHKESQLGY